MSDLDPTELPISPEAQERPAGADNSAPVPEFQGEPQGPQGLRPSGGKTPLWPGSTGGLLSMAAREEKYQISWTSPKQQVFELPTGGAATMVQGVNAIYFAKKEQALALGRQLRNFKITDYKVWREFPNGDQVYLHPKDGVFPEKVNAGRPIVNSVGRKIGDNPNPIKVKFTGKQVFDV